MAWYNANWQYRKKLTIDNTKIDDTLSNFPTLVKLDYANFDFSKAKAAGEDIRFTSDDGQTELKYERESHALDIQTHYKCNDDAANTTVTDSSGNGNTGTSANNTSTMSVTGKVNDAFEFDSGVPDYIDAPTSSLDLDVLTIAFWFKSSTDSAGSAFFIRDSGGANLSNIVLGDGATGELTNELITILTNRSGTSNRVGYCTATRTELFDGNWHHIAIVMDGSYKIYLDNNLKSTTVAVGSDDGEWGSSLTASLARIGSDNVWNFNLNGNMDDIRIYSKALSAGEISEIYNSGNGTEDHLLGSAYYWTKVTSIASGDDTDIYMYYGYDSASDGEDAQNVWDANFKDIIHFQDSSPHADDSTSNGNNGTLSGADISAGEVNHALTLNGSTDYMSIAGLITALASDTKGTMSFWAKIASDDTFENVIFSVSRNADATRSDLFISLDMRAGGDNISIKLTTDGTVQWHVDTPVDSLDPYVNTWVKITVVHDGTDAKIFINDTSQSLTWAVSTDKTKWLKAILTDATNKADTCKVGTLALNGGDIVHFEGRCDELRISNTNRADAWVKAEYYSETDALLTFGSEETGTLIVNESDTVYISDTIQFGTEIVEESDTLYVSDTIEVDVSLEKITDSETIYISDSISVSTVENINNPVRILHYNPLVVVTNTDPVKLGIITITDPANPTWVVYDLAGVTNAKDVVLNDTNDYFYVACASGAVAKVEKADPNNFSIISTGDSDVFVNTDSLEDFFRTYISTDDSDGEIVVIDEAEIKKINTDLRWIEQIETIISTRLNTILGSLVNTDFRWRAETNKKINTDLRWLPLNQTYDQVTQNPIVYGDIVVKINGTDLCPLNDVNMKSIRIEHDITREEEVGSVATFTLNRQHDKLDYDNQGNGSQITNNNAVIVEIDGHTEFTGKVSKLKANSETETVQVIAVGTRPSDKRHTVSIPLPSVNENLHLYHCLINDVDIDNPYISTTDENPAYYKGVQVDLGTQIEQKVLRYRSVRSTSGLATKIENGNFNPKQNWTYFWLAAFTNFITGLTNGTLKYLGTSLGSLSTDSWKLDRCSYKYQKELDDVETDLGNYQVGSAPYLEVSTKNGKKITIDKWVDKKDGLYLVKDAGYDYEQYAKDVADLEYSKLLNINGNVLPATSAQITLSFDGYYYYNLALLTRINVTNTTTSNIYKNANGFPIAIKTIVIDTSTMTVNLTCDNQLSQIELDEIDDTYPDENSDEYVFAEDSRKIHSKFDPNTWGYPA